MTKEPLRRKLLFRLAALSLGLMPLVLIELTLAALGWGEPDWQEDPFVGFRGIRPLFVLNAAQDRYEIPPARQNYFRPQSFPASKAPGEYRVFCLGGSTVQGSPYSTETAFSKWLEIALRAANPQRSFHVINCGGVSYASYRLIPILQEVLGYHPDLIVVCTGHNEFLEDRTYRHVKQQPAILAMAQGWAAHVRLYCLLRASWLHWRGQTPQPLAADRPVLGEEVDSRLDYRGGLSQYHRDDQWHRDVITHFGLNLERMVHLTRQAGVRLLLVNPVSNLRDCPPFKSEHQSGLSPQDLQRWEQLWNEAKPAYRTDLRQAVACLERAAAIDDRHAGLHYQLGQCYDALGDLPPARRHYTLAKDLDVCPLRMLTAMQRVLQDVASRTKTPLLDADVLIAERCRGGIPDDSWLVDHVHPSICGHQVIADAIAGWLIAEGWLQPDAGYDQRRSAAYRAHLASLDSFYFEEGRRRLEHLRDWARGRATIVRSTTNGNARTAPNRKMPEDTR
jgi:lysophospholipase L1-like esterase